MMTVLLLLTAIATALFGSGSLAWGVVGALVATSVFLQLVIVCFSEEET